MIETVITVISVIVALRTVTFGVWTLKSRNISGGVFVLLLVVAELAGLTMYLLRK